MIRSLPLRINLISLLFASLVAAVLTGLGGLFLHHQQRVNALEHARESADEIALRAQRLLALDLRFADFINFDAQCAEALHGDNALREAAVFDLRGRQVFHSHRSQLEWPATLSAEAGAAAEVHVDGATLAVRPIVLPGGGLQGHAVAVVDERAVLRETLNAVGWLAASAVLLVGAGLVVQQLILWSAVGRPLAELVKLADSIQPDASSALPPPGVAGTDDIGRVHAAFGRLLRRLGDARAELIRHNEQLEATVRERTAELARLNGALELDIERRKLLEAELRTLASTDALTGLANRGFVLPYLERRVALAQRDGAPLAVMVLDLDRFKHINDTHGHAAGDHVLRETALRVVAVCRQSDVVARIGGDEFLVVLERIESLEAAEVLGRRLRAAFDLPVAYGPLQLAVGVSIGAAIFPVHGSDSASLMAAADAAMYEVKRRGGGFDFARAEPGPGATGSAGASAPAPS